MSGLKSRNKGKRAEREVKDLLNTVVMEVCDRLQVDVGVRPKLQRNQLQSDGGGYDLVGIDWIALEVKHQEQMNIESWWVQCVNQAKGNQMPVLFYRRNHMKWRVRTYGMLWLPNGGTMAAPADFALQDFIDYFRIRLEQELRRSDLE